MRPAIFSPCSKRVQPHASPANLPLIAPNPSSICRYAILQRKPFGICSCKTHNLKPCRISRYRKTYTRSPSPRAAFARGLPQIDFPGGGSIGRACPQSRRAPHNYFRCAQSNRRSLLQNHHSHSALRCSPPTCRCSPALGRRSVSPPCILPHLSQNRSQSSRQWKSQQN